MQFKILQIVYDNQSVSDLKAPMVKLPDLLNWGKRNGGKFLFFAGGGTYTGILAVCVRWIQTPLHLAYVIIASPPVLNNCNVFCHRVHF